MAYTNTRDTGDLVITKTVTGSGGEEDKLFDFTVTLKNATVDLNKTFGDVTFSPVTEGDTHEVQATFALKHGESKTITGIPVGTDIHRDRGGLHRRRLHRDKDRRYGHHRSRGRHGHKAHLHRGLHQQPRCRQPAAHEADHGQRLRTGHPERAVFLHDRFRADPARGHEPRGQLLCHAGKFGHNLLAGEIRNPVYMGWHRLYLAARYRSGRDLYDLRPAGRYDLQSL